MKKYLYALSAISAALIIGCGESSSVSDQQFTYDTSSIFGYSKEITYKNYLVEAVDDPIIHATVKATNCEDFEEIGNGKYLLKKCVDKPTLIEVKNGIIKDANVTQSFPLILNVVESNLSDNFVVTPLTTILANATDRELNDLALKLGVDKEDLFSNRNEKVKRLFSKINLVLIASTYEGAITNKVKFLNVVKNSVINNINEDGDLNVNGVINEVQLKSQENPNLFGLVIIHNSIDNEDPLESLVRIQNSKTVRFYGLVFDSAINNATIIVKDLDTNRTYEISGSSNNYGAWSFEIERDNSEESLYNIIMNTNHLLQFIAIKRDGNKDIKLTSTITTKKLRDLLTKTQILSPTLDNSLIISNITTARDAILDKRGALNSENYESNLSELKVYYQDKVLKAAAMIKAVVDENESSNYDTYDLVKNSIEDIETLKINTSDMNTNLSEIENNISKNTILSYQLNYVNTYKMNDFQKVSEQSGYVFYRLLAYYNSSLKTDDNFVREYTKFIVYPGHYEVHTCYLYGNSTSEWSCNEPEIIENKSNFTLGHYVVNYNDNIIDYSLDFNFSYYVERLNKTYNLFGVLKSSKSLSTGLIKTEPMILVNSYDIVDAFRRMPEFDREDFEKLKDIVYPYNNREEVNFELNRWVKIFIDKVDNYFENK